MGKRGPKPWTPTAEDIAKIEALSGQGMNKQDIAALLGTGRATFFKHLAESPEMQDACKAGKVKAMAIVTGKLWQLMNGIEQMTPDGKKAYLQQPNVKAIMFYLTKQGGPDWRDKMQVQGDPQSPLQIKNVRELSDDDLNALARLIEKGSR